MKGVGGDGGRGGAAGFASGGEAMDNQAGEGVGGAGGSDDGWAHRMALCEAICAKDPTGQGSSCEHEDECIDVLCQPWCTPRLDVLLECLAALEDSKFGSCSPTGALPVDTTAYYYCYDPFMRWLACE